MTTREAEAVRLLRQSKAALSSHGPCRDNGCSECRRTFDEVRAFLASPSAPETLPEDEGMGLSKSTLRRMRAQEERRFTLKSEDDE